MTAARPRWWNDHATLAAIARYLHRQRVEGYPELIEAGKITAEVAATQTRIMGAIADGWEAIAKLAPEPAGLHDGHGTGAFAWERREALANLSLRFRAAADQAPDDEEAVGMADAVDALLWWETAQPSARFLVDTTLALRAQAAATRAAQPLARPIPAWAADQPSLLFGEAA